MLSFFSFAQQQTINNIGDIGIMRTEDKDSEQSEILKKINYKKYHSLDFKKASADNIKGDVFFRYNMYKDEMEFMKADQIYYMRKKLGSTINFKNDNVVYKIFNSNNKLNYFNILVDGKCSLLVKEVVEFTEAKAAKSSYVRAKPAKFTREDDEYFISLDGKNTVEIPRKKNDFFDLFKEDSKKIKDYVKENRLSHKDKNDLKKIVIYYNTL